MKHVNCEWDVKKNPVLTIYKNRPGGNLELFEKIKLCENDPDKVCPRPRLSVELFMRRIGRPNLSSDRKLNQTSNLGRVELIN